MNPTTTFRTLRDLGGAAWFGGAIMGATGLNAAADAALDTADRDRIVSAGWAAWSPVFRAAAASHLLGSLGVAAQERSRAAAVSVGLSASAAGVVVGAGVLGGRKDKDTEKIVHALEWVTPALLAAVLVLGARR